MSLFKTCTTLTSLFIATHAIATPLGIIGGEDNSGTGPAYAALISSSETPMPLNLGISNGQILGVAMNGVGMGIIGGQNFSSAAAYAALVSASGTLTPLALGVSDGFIGSIAINSSGEGFVGGRDSLLSSGYAAFISPVGAVTSILGLPDAYIRSVAINDSQQALIGGQELILMFPGYAATVSPTGIATSISLPGGISTNGVINSVAINATSQGLLGGINEMTNVPFAATVSPAGSATLISLPGISSGDIRAVAINDAGQGIVGGQNAFDVVYAALISPSGTATQVPLNISTGMITSIAMSASGQGIIGGREGLAGGPAYAALIAPSGAVTPVNLNVPNGVINSVAINNFGQAIIGGEQGAGGPAYAALISSSGMVTPLNVGISNGSIFSVAISSSIPTSSVTGNNLIFANYINQNAPQDTFYFIPASLDGTLSTALASAAPTRNGASTYTASNNLMFLTTTVSTHLRSQSATQSAPTRGFQMAMALPEEMVEEELLASLSLPEQEEQAMIANNMRMRQTQRKGVQRKPYTIWFDAIGATAFQKAQNQTPAFHPVTGGAILGFDAAPCYNIRVGGGASYFFTHIHESDGAGYSHINQENLFAYVSWNSCHFYVDGAVWGGLFQTKQTRNIHMTGFNFTSSSSPHGWQLLPHLELGYQWGRCYCRKDLALKLNPFAMLDWANAWQGSFKETGDSPFNVGQPSHHSSLLRTEVGLRFYETVFFNSWNLVVQEKGSYVNTQSFGAGRVNAFIVGSPGAFTVETLSSAQNLGVAQVAMTFDPLNSSYPISTIFYQGEFGGQYQSHQVNVEVAWNF